MESQWEISRSAPTFEPLEERLLLSSQFIGPMTLGLAGADVSGAPGALSTDAARASAATPAELISALTPSSEGPVVKATPVSQSPATVAPAVLYATGFEAGEGFSPGFLNSQAGWSTFPANVTQPVISTAHPASGQQHLRIGFEAASGAGTYVGGFSPNLGTMPAGHYVTSVDVAISATGGADYDVVPQAPSQSFLSARVNFSYLGDILVLDDPGSGLQYVDTGTDWAVGPYRNLTIDLDAGANTIHYYYGGSLIYTSQGGVYAGTAVEEVVLFSDNFNIDDVGDFDNLRIQDTSEDQGEIHGSKWHDLDGDGVWDAGEPGLPDWKIYLDENASGQWDTGEPYEMTDGNGDYAFTDLPEGTYIVAEVLKPGWEQTYPGAGGEGDLYAVDSNLDNLYELNKASGASTLVGSTASGPDTPAGLAWDGSDMYTIDLMSPGGLYTLNLGTAAPTLVGSTAVGGWQGIAADPTDSGQLWGITQTDDLYTIAPNGTASLVASGVGDLITALEFDGSGTLWGIECFTGNYGTINTATGAFTVLGTTSLDQLQGLDFDSAGTMYVHRTTDDALYTLDPSTAIATLVGSSGTDFVKGLSFASLPGTPAAPAGGVVVPAGQPQAPAPEGVDLSAAPGTSDPALAGKGLIDGFEDGNITEYAEYAGPTLTSVSGAAAHDGSYGLLDAQSAGTDGWLFRLDAAAQVAQGDVLSTWVNLGDIVGGVQADGRAYFAFGASATGTLSAVLAPNTNTLILMDNSGLDYLDLTTVSQTYAANTWYRLEVDWGSGGTIVASLFASDGTTLLNTVSATTNVITSGGIGFRAFGTDKYWDTVTKTGGGDGPGTHTIVLGPGEVVVDVDFGNKSLLGEIRGSKWNDLDGDGVWDAGELGLPDWKIYFDENASGQWDTGEPYEITDANGDYAFTDLTPGTYLVAEVLQAGWEQTYPNGAPAGSGGKGLNDDLGVEITTTGSTAPIYLLGDTTADVTPPTNVSGPLINMDAFRADPRFSGIEGSGFATVILDTGIDLNHPFFGPDGDSDGVADRIVYSYDFADGDADASDQNDHGSNVSSITASQDATYTGMAPAADIIHLKVFTDGGSGNFSYVESALQWVVANAAAYNIASVNMSLGDGGNYNTPQALYGVSDEMAALEAMDVIVVSASGNDFYAHGSAQGAAYPAADANSMSIGAVWDSDCGGPWYWSGGAIDYTTGTDRIVSFSQRHASMTTVFAPGAVITGANKSGGTVGMTGTSQASPHICGIVALAQELAVQELGRRLTFTELTELLRTTGVTINDGDDEDDNVTNTGLDFERVNMLALGEGILAMAGGGGTHTVVLDPGEIEEDVDFGNRASLGEIHGSKWHDLDADGVWDAGEPGLPDWTIYLDENDNEQWDTGEPYDITDANGDYSFTDLPEGTYIVAEVLKDGWEQTYPGGAPAGPAGAMLAPAQAVSNEAAAQVTGQLFDVDTSWIDGAGTSALWNLDLDPVGAKDPAPPWTGVYDIYVEQGLLSSISTALNVHVADLTAEGYTVTVQEYSGTAAALRTHLAGRYSQYGLEGALFVGDIPYVDFTSDDSFKAEKAQVTYPHDLYFMDLDGTYVLNAVGLDSHTAGSGDVGPEIYVSRLTTGNLSGVTGQGEAALINSYLGKVHAYRTGALQYANRGIVWADDDWQTWGAEQMQDLYTEVLGINNPAQTTKAGYLSTLGLNYESILECIHSSATSHAVTVGGGYEWISSTEIYNTNPRQGFYNMFNCSGALFTVNDNLAGVYVYGGDYGLNAVGSTKTGSMLYFPDYYTPQGSNDSVGQAFQQWFDIYAAPTDNPGQDWMVDWFYGMTMQGDATLKPASMPGQGGGGGRHVVDLGPGEIEEDVDFGNQAVTGEIRGSKWNDLDADGVWDAGEPGLGGWKIYADLNHNGQWDTGEPFDITGPNGDYLFQVSPGTYTVAEVLQTDWEQTYPTGGGGGGAVLDTAVRTIFLERTAGSGSASMNVAYNPDTGYYYASEGGNPGYAAWVFDGAGNRIQTLQPVNIDVRSWNYNPHTGLLEVVPYAAVTGSTGAGLFEAQVDGAGLLTGGTSVLLASMPGANGTQTMPAYDPNDDWFYSRDTDAVVNLARRSDGGLAGTVSLDLAAAGATGADVTYFAIGYDEVNDWLVVTDYVNERALVFDTAGNYLGDSQLDIDVDYYYGMGFTNGQLFVYDNARSGWQGYTISGAGGGGLYFSEDLNATGLYTLDTSTGAATNVGISSVNGSTVGLAPTDSAAMLYGSRPFALLHINSDGSGATDVGGVGTEGLAYDQASGTLYGAINGSFFTVNPADGSLITYLAAAPDDVEGIAFGNGGVYGLVGYYSTDTNLYFYNPGTDAWSVVGNTGIDWDLVGLAYDPGTDTLYAKGSQDSLLYAINPNTAATAVIGDTGIGEGGGLAFVSAGGEEGTHTVHVGPGDVVEDVDFGNFPTGLGQITGKKWYDGNRNGLHDAGEPGLPDWRIYVDQDLNGQWDQGEPFDITDCAGNYLIQDVPAGVQVVGEESTDDWKWQQTLPGALYATDRATSDVYLIDPATGAATLVGNIGYIASLTGLSFDDGPLYASDLYANDWSLGYLDLNTGAGTIIGPQNDWNIHAIAHQDGTLYGFSISQGLGKIDPSTGAFVDLPDQLPVTMHGADFDETAQAMYALGSDNVLYTVDVTTGTAAAVGATGVNFNGTMGLAYNPANGQLYAVGDDATAAGDNLYRIDKATGAATLIGPTGLVQADSLEYVTRGAPNTPGTYTVMVLPGQTIRGLNFANILAGDNTGDGTVDYNDLGWLATHYDETGASWANGDYTGNGVVDYVDLGLLATNYDRTIILCGGVFYGWDAYASALFSIDADGNVTDFPPVAPTLSGLAYDTLDRVMYGHYGGDNNLYTVNLANGQLILLGTLKEPTSYGLAYNPLDDLLYSINDAGELVQIDPDTLDSQVVSGGAAGTSTGGMAYMGQRLYAHSNVTPRMFSYDATTFTGPVTHAAPDTSPFFGMAYDGASLVLADGPGATLYTYNLATGSTALMFPAGLLGSRLLNALEYVGVGAPAPEVAERPDVVLDIPEGAYVPSDVDDRTPAAPADTNAGPSNPVPDVDLLTAPAAQPAGVENAARPWVVMLNSRFDGGLSGVDDYADLLAGPGLNVLPAAIV